MMKRTLITIAAVAVSVVGFAGTASADVSTNKSVKDALGYCNANHIANFNGDHHGIGWARSTQTGAEISAQNLNLPSFCVDTQGDYAPISNNG